MKKFTDTEIASWEACRNKTAISIPQDYKVLRIAGEDHLRFLQGQTTNDILSLKDGQGQQTAFLTPKAKVRSLALAFRCGDCVYLLIPQVTCKDLTEHLEKYIVMEDVSVDVLEHGLVAVSGPEARELLEDKLKCSLRPVELYEHQQLELGNKQLALCLTGLYGENTYLFFVKDTEDLCSLLQDNNIPVLNPAVQRILNMEAGIPNFPADINNNTLFPETGLQTECVNYSKGCFVGQEIVARVKYRGSVNRSLMGIIYDDEAPEENDDFSVRGQKAGFTTSTGWSPFLKKFISMAYISKKFRTPDQRYNLEINGKSFKAKVVLLPFYLRQSEKEEAENLYHNAVKIFSAKGESDDKEVEKLLRKAILKNPTMADAYEVLGVVLSRHERYDEAIELMKQLKEINPNEVMAYSNLSLYYMKKGMIQEAEDEKAAATAAGFKKAAEERKKNLEKQNNLKKEEEEAQRKISMFSEVLELDSEDLIANFGLGKALLEQGNAQEAVTYLEKCLKIKDNYSVAFLQLGLAYMRSNNKTKAREVFKNGINCALTNGDLMPKKQMEQHLAELESAR